MPWWNEMLPPSDHRFWRVLEVLAVLGCLVVLATHRVDGAHVGEGGGVHPQDAMGAGGTVWVAIRLLVSSWKT